MKYKLYLNGNVISDEIFIADTFFKRLRGYMFYKEPFVNTIAIKPCNSIHTFFMKFPIDVLFLDSEMLVLKKETNMSKNEIIPPVKNSKYVLETIAFGFSEVKEGDLMSIC